MFVRSTLIAVALLTSTAASAQQASIRYRAYELTSAEGRQSVADRIQTSVHNACRSAPWLATVNQCRKALSAEMLMKIGNTDVAARYGGRPVQLASRH